jgi:hypothetical protein
LSYAFSLFCSGYFEDGVLLPGQPWQQSSYFMLLTIAGMWQGCSNMPSFCSLRWRLVKFFAWAGLNFDSSDLCFPSESQMPGIFVSFIGQKFNISWFTLGFNYLFSYWCLPVFLNCLHFFLD